MTTYDPKAANKLTQRQNQVLQFITSFTGDNGYPPSQREIARPPECFGNTAGYETS